MLVNAILITLAGVLNAVISVLPIGGQLPASIDGALQFVADQIAGINSFLPFVSTMVTILLLMLTIEGFIFAYGGVNWTINKLRGSG